MCRKRPPARPGGHLEKPLFWKPRRNHFNTLEGLNPLICTFFEVSRSSGSATAAFPHRAKSMPVVVVGVGVVRVGVAEAGVAVGVDVRLAGGVRGRMDVAMVFVVVVAVGVLQRRVLVAVVVALGQMQPDAERPFAKRA